MKEMPQRWMRVLISALVPEGAVYSIIRNLEAYDPNCTVRIRSEREDPPALPSDVEAPQQEPKSTRKGRPVEKGHVYHLTCRNCGAKFEASGSRVLYCAECKPQMKHGKGRRKA